MSYRCLVYVVNDVSKIGATFGRQVREAQLSARRGVIAIFRVSSVRELIPQVRETLLNNVAMGIVLLTVEKMDGDSVRKSLRRFIERKLVADARILFEEGLEAVANELNHVFREWGINVDLVKV